MVFLSRAPEWYQNGTNLLHGERESLPSDVGSVNSRGHTARRELLRAESQGLQKACSRSSWTIRGTLRTFLGWKALWFCCLWGFQRPFLTLQLHSTRDLHIGYLGLSVWFATQWCFVSCFLFEMVIWPVKTLFISLFQYSLQFLNTLCYWGDFDL